ncbi:MAG: valine--tRNA ligase [Verrucomicrobiota bacterium]|nr:valine--tRNA ligase [Verrucomicrobiota bacterium]
MSHLAKAYDPKLIEEKWYAFWEEGGFFKADPNSGKKPYCIVIPPPNVTGVLHMGHALVDTLEDILIRWKRMQGFEALWVPGTDHAGIATQMVVEKQLMAKTGKRRKDFSREEFLQHVWDWKKVSEERILHQLKKLGCSCDWSRLRFTMDEQLSRAVRVCFKRMYDDGLIYRGDYLVNWDPVAQTALSDDEVEHEERQSFLWHIRYPLADGSGEVVVATTRPETMLGDTGVAVHPEDERYRGVVGKQIRLPLTDRLVPVVADPFVDPKFGTGAVKLTPAHDFNDFEAGRRHQLPMINILTPDGKLNQEAGRFAGLSVEEGREKVAAELQKMGFLVKKEPHTLRVGLSYRSKAVVQPYLSKQWFVKVTHFKDKLIRAVKEKKVRLVPPHWEATYFHWIENLRDWCISRQLWWGHRIPIWYDKINPNHFICYDGEREPPEVALDPGRYAQDEDVLDTWFSSALWPFSVFGWPEKTDDLKTFYPTSTLITGHDILFFWVARMIMMGEYAMKEVPFKETFLHGLIYGKSYWRMSKEGMAHYVSPDEKKNYDLGATPPSDVSSKWEKMSKSKGNVIDPIEIISEYGTDALRIALTSSVTHARQIDLDLRRFEEFKNFANKVWNGARFVFLNLEGLTSAELAQGLDRTLFTLEDRWMLSLLNRTIEEMSRCLTEYTFDRAATRSYEFFWNDFCAVYVELAKPILFGKTGTPELRKNKQKLLVILLSNALRLMHPIVPFITEEIFSLLQNAFLDLQSSHADPYTSETIQALLSPACIVAPYPTVRHPSDIDLKAEEAFQHLQELVRAIRNIRTEMQLPPQEKSDLILCGPTQDLRLIEEHQSILLALTPTTHIHFEPADYAATGATAIIGNLKVVIPIPDSLKAKEKQRLEKELEKARKLLENTKNQLANPDFRAKAPPQLVEKLEQTERQTSHQISEMTQKLKTI